MLTLISLIEPLSKVKGRLNSCSMVFSFRSRFLSLHSPDQREIFRALGWSFMNFERVDSMIGPT